MFGEAAHGHVPGAGPMAAEDADAAVARLSPAVRLLTAAGDCRGAYEPPDRDDVRWVLMAR